jgi:hypothetical protein
MAHIIGQVRKHMDGVYRVTLNDREFAQVSRRCSVWHADVRDIETGVLVRYAGVWKSRAAALAEVCR